MNATVQTNQTLSTTKALPLNKLDAQFASYDASNVVLVHHDLGIKHLNVPQVNKGYVFRKDLVRDILTFWNSNDVAMKLIGHKGTGKTTLPEQFCARIKVPLLSQTCDQTMDRTTFIGSWVLASDVSEQQVEQGSVIESSKKGLMSSLASLASAMSLQPKMKFVLGSVLTAAQNGWPVLLNEYNALDPNAATALNDLLEGKSIYVEQIGKTITPKKGFKVFATVNPETAGLYSGRHEQDTANDDRFWAVNVDYPAPEVEVSIVEALFKAAGTDAIEANSIATSMVDIANKVRAVYMGTNDSAAAIEQTISTRALVRWANLMMAFKGVVNDGLSPFHYALERAVTNHCKSFESKNAIHQIAFEVIGEEWKK